MHALSRAVTSASVAAIPCGTDLRQMRMEIDATRIDDPVLAQEVADFSRDCYGPARAKLFMQRPDLDEQQMHDVTWIGSRFFTDTGGYYDCYRRSEEHTSELQSLMRISYAVFCLKKKKTKHTHIDNN